jgi:pimeloyl-ACP methyl ester carboxylesterase
MARSRVSRWTSRIRRRVDGTRSSVGTAVRQLGHWLRHHGLVRVRRPGTPRVVSTRSAHNGSVALAYDVRGRGSPLVLIQGLGVGRWGWEPVADRLARRVQVITIDNRGIGASDAPPGPYSIGEMVDDVIAVLDDAGVRRASVVGTSLGGMVAQELALAHPDRVDKLVLVSTIPGGRLTSPMPLETARLLTWAPFMASEAKLRGFVENALGPETLRRRSEIVERLMAQKLAHPQSERAWQAQATAGVLFNPRGRQRRIIQPTLILQGTADQVVNPDNADLLAALIPDTRLELFEGAGHLLYWDEPERFARVVTGFLTDRATSVPVSDRAVRPAS